MNFKNIYQNILYFIKNRFILFGLFFVIFIISFYLYSGSFFPSTETKDLWFYSGIFMVLFSILFIEPYYTSPKNVITNAIPLLLVFLAIKTSFDNQAFWWAAIITLILLILSSIFALTIEDKNKSLEHWKNKTSIKIKDIVVIIGQGKVLYSSVFIYFLLTYHSIQDFYTVVLFILWFFVVTIDPKKIHGSFSSPHKNKKKEQIGEIFGVQSKKVFLARIYDDIKNVNKFDIVKFKYSLQDADSNTIIGIVFDVYFLSREKWAKIIQLKEREESSDMLEENIIYKIFNKETIRDVGKEIRMNDFVGIVVDNSNIGKIKFEYSKKEDDLQDEELLELKVGLSTIYYQVVAGTTKKEKLEEKNETGFIEGEALQLGEWKNEDLFFQKFGWVPAIGTPIFKANTSDIAPTEFSLPDYKLGVIPNTKLPSIINLDKAISHHMALIGITGSGKSFLAREIINQIKIDTKVICIDFNKEFVSTLTPPPANIISDMKAQEISEKIDWINNELDKFSNQQDKAQIAQKKTEIKTALKEEIESFLNDSTCNIKIFELPDVSNTTGIFDYTKYFFRVLFEIAKEKQIAGNPAKICVVLEEAHTIIPEWNFSGSGDKTSQGLVNSIGQITLQGRKYGIGFLVIAQRTANVSKTVLTQCNTVICFRAFDETSFSFLGNYVGKDMIQVLPNLKQYHAVVAGKAVKSNIPMIIDLTR
jgi:hypothetical protein